MASQGHLRPWLAGKRCLVLDDEFLIGLDIQSILEQAGATNVVTFDDVQGVLAALNGGECFDAAVLDLKIGGQSSLPVAATLTERQTPFVFLTGMSGDGIHTRQFPGVPVVVKPFDDERLLAALQAAMTGTSR